MKKAKDFKFKSLKYDDRGFSRHFSCKDEIDEVVCRVHNVNPEYLQGYLDIWHTAANGMLDKIGPLPWVADNDLAYAELRLYINMVIVERGIYSGIQMCDFGDKLHIHLGNIDDGEIETERGTRYGVTVNMFDGIEIKRRDAKTLRKYRNFGNGRAVRASKKQFKRFVRACELLGVTSWHEVMGDDYEDRNHWNSHYFKVWSRLMFDGDTIWVRRDGSRAFVWPHRA